MGCSGQDRGTQRPCCAQASDAELAARVPRDRAIVLVGMMGVGKSAIGRRLAASLQMPFFDADAEIEAAAGLAVSEIFERHGEAEFRRGERSVIARLLDGPPHVLATGGGAFMDEETRAKIKERAVSIWLDADLDVVLRRVSRRGGRPLLQVADPRAALEQLMQVRAPFYRLSDLTVESSQSPHRVAVRAVLEALAAFAGGCQPAQPPVGQAPNPLGAEPAGPDAPPQAQSGKDH